MAEQQSESPTDVRLSDLGKKLAALEAEKDTLEGRVTEINKELQALKEITIPEAMQAAECDRHSITGLGSLTIPTKFYGYVKAEDREKFFQWLRDNENGALIKESVHPQTLNGFVKEQYEAGTSLPEFIAVRTVPTAKLTKARSK